MKIPPVSQEAIKKSPSCAPREEGDLPVSLDAAGELLSSGGKIQASILSKVFPRPWYIMAPLPCRVSCFRLLVPSLASQQLADLVSGSALGLGLQRPSLLVIILARTS